MENVTNDSSYLLKEGHTFYPDKIIWAISTFFLVGFSYFVVKNEYLYSNSLLQLSLTIIAPLGSVWSGSRLLPLCHSIKLTPYGLHITKYYKTKYISWRGIENIDVGYRKSGNYIWLTLKGNTQFDRLFASYDEEISGFYNIRKSALVSLMYDYKYQSKKYDLGWSDPNTKPSSLFNLPESWGRDAAKKGEAVSKKSVWEKIIFYRNS